MGQNMKKTKITELLIFIVSAELIGALSALFSGNSFSFYKELTKPPLSPPGWIFPIMWTILYALMGASAFLIYNSDTKKKYKALTLYGIQLFVNFVWSIVFFRFNLLAFSVAVILMLLILIIAMIIQFHKIRPLSAYLNIPYLLWVLFASYLNIGVLILNRS